MQKFVIILVLIRGHVYESCTHTDTKVVRQLKWTLVIGESTRFVVLNNPAYIRVGAINLNVRYMMNRLIIKMRMVKYCV